VNAPFQALPGWAGQFLWPAGLGLFLAAASLVDPGGQLGALELKTQDARARAYAAATPLTGDIVLVDISEQSLRRLEPVFGRWPWPRSAHGEVVAYLARDGAKAVAFDIIFSERNRTAQLDETALRELSVFAGNADIPEVRDALLARLAALTPAAGDDFLARKTAEAGNVVSPVVFYVDDDEARLSPGMAASGPDLAAARAALAGSGVPTKAAEPAFPRFHTAITPYPELAKASKRLGHINFLPDADGLCRRYRPLVRFDGADDLYPSLALAVAATALGVAPADIAVTPDQIRIGARALPLAADGTAFIKFQGGPGVARSGKTEATPTYAHEAYETVLSSAHQAAQGLKTALPRGRFKDKIVLIGTTAVGLKDVRATALSPVTPSFEIQANIIDAILSGVTPQALPRAWTLVLTPALCLAAALLVSACKAAAGVPASLVLAAGAPLAAWTLYGQGIVAPMAAPGLAILASAIAGGAHKYYRESREKARIKAAFGQYLAPAVMEEILKHPENLRLGGAKRVLTVLFSDIKDFTALAENLPAEDVAALLNGYFTRMAACVTQTGGIVDKFIGDALMAEWNAPGPAPDHAARACRAALLMREALDALNRDARARGKPELAMRIGINTGEMIVGNMGAEHIFDYSVIGNEVNTASRIEALGKLFGSGILAAGATADAALFHAPGEFVFRRLGLVRIKGRARELPVYELAGSPARLSERAQDGLRAYERGLALYEAGRGDQALAAFEDAARLIPGDGPADLLARLCRERQATPGTENFSGIIEQKEK
jgi:adenylate cyclase